MCLVRVARACLSTPVTGANVWRRLDMMLRSLPPKAKEKGKDCPCVWKIQNAQAVRAGVQHLHPPPPSTPYARAAFPGPARLWHALPAVQRQRQRCNPR